MPEIRQLPASVVNKIAAGEVIERPASVVKELLENAIDAGATRIEVAIEQGGSELVRVADDGCGIDADQLPLAVASHATSKIRDAGDLFHVGTLGFRGEALASIAEVSRFRITSRTGQSTAGTSLEVTGGQTGPLRPCGCPVGTVVEVRDLFWNTPVRRKFLRTTQTEMGHICESFIRVALAHSPVHFALRHNGRSLFELPATEDWRSRIAAFFGPEVADQLIWIEAVDGPLELSGYAANPSVNRGNNRMQYLFLNGRYIRDRSLAHALGEAYRGLLMTARFPVAFLRLNIPPDEIDVNVHPTKLEVRFQDSGRIYSHLLASLRGRFLSMDLTAHVQAGPASRPMPGGVLEGMDEASAARQRDELLRWAKGEQVSSSDYTGGHGSHPSRPSPLDLAARPRTEPWRVEGSKEPELAPERIGTHAPMATTVDGYPAVQVHNRYLITENEEGVVVIDQHALHERILYEQLREKLMEGALETQRLLVPEPVRLTASEAAAALDAADVLAKLGIEVSPFGGDTVLVSTYPAMLANLRPDQLLRQLLEKLISSDHTLDRRDLLDELLHMISCKAAIKAGDRLSREEICALIEHRGLVQDSHHCPHGRPTALVFTREELDRRFKRT